MRFLTYWNNRVFDAIAALKAHGSSAPSVLVKDIIEFTGKFCHSLLVNLAELTGKLFPIQNLPVNFDALRFFSKYCKPYRTWACSGNSKVNVNYGTVVETMVGKNDATHTK